MEAKRAKIRPEKAKKATKRRSRGKKEAKMSFSGCHENDLGG